MERLRGLPEVRVVDDSSDEVGEWIPTQQEFLQVYKDVRTSGNKPHYSGIPLKEPKVNDIIPTSRKVVALHFWCNETKSICAVCMRNRRNHGGKHLLHRSGADVTVQMSLCDFLVYELF